MTRIQYIITEPRHAGEGRHLGSYPDVATAYRAAIKRGALTVYLHCPNDFPVKMFNENDTHGMAWCSGGAS
jgi:hypothetical protein